MCEYRIPREELLWETSLGELFALRAAAIVRQGGSISGPTYADLDFLDRLRASNNRPPLTP